MSSAARPASPFPPDLAPAPQPAWKGAWGGAWTVLYGGIAVLAGIWNVALLDFCAAGTRLGAARFRTSVPPDADADVVRRVGELLDTAPAAFGAALRGWHVGEIALAAVVVLAGVGVLARSAAARRVALAAVVATGLTSVALLVWWALRVLPAYDAWRETALLLQEDARSQGAGNPLGFLRMLPARTSLIASHSVTVVLQLVLVAALVKRLAGLATRTWCREGGGRVPGPPKLPVASSGAPR